LKPLPNVRKGWPQIAKAQICKYLKVADRQVYVFFKEVLKGLTIRSAMNKKS
jgi:hypothetical protein